MNRFANSLFTLLFGWARGVIQQVWVSSSSGHFSGLFVWLGKNWVWVALALALIGTAVDMLVWLFRWQPYRVWQTRARHLTRMFSSGKTSRDRRFAKGYQGGVALDMAQEEAPQNDPPPDPEWDEQAWKAFENPQPEDTRSFTEELMKNADFGGTARERQGRSKNNAAEKDEPSALVTASWLSTAYQNKAASATVRKRRSEKYDKKKPGWTNRLMIPEVEEDSLIDGLPPAVDRQRAFHDPVYPMKNNADTDWQTAPGGQPAEENYKR